MIQLHHVKKEEIWNTASRYLIDSINKDRETLLFLSGGSAVRIYGELVKEIRESGADWGFLAFAQIDERFQPENKEDVNADAIAKTGLWKACKEKNIPYYLILQEGTLEEAVRRYNEQISSLFEHFTYKIGVLGIGEDCHTAGLLPGYEKSWDKDTFAVGYKNNGEFSCRITVTPKVLSHLDQAVVVVAGEKKRRAIEKALNPSNSQNLDEYPAVIIQKSKKTDLFTDSAVNY